LDCLSYLSCLSSLSLRRTDAVCGGFACLFRLRALAWATWSTLTYFALAFWICVVRGALDLSCLHGWHGLFCGNRFNLRFDDCLYSSLNNCLDRRGILSDRFCDVGGL
jgi:hypothetical protein